MEFRKRLPEKVEAKLVNRGLSPWVLKLIDNGAPEDHSLVWSAAIEKGGKLSHMALGLLESFLTEFNQQHGWTVEQVSALRKRVYDLLRTRRN